MIKTVKEKAKLSNLDHFIDSIRLFLEELSVSDNVIFDIILASEEILVNVMSYAYPKGQEGDVEVLCELIDGRGARKVKFTFKDNGVSFDVLEKANPDFNQPLEKMKIGGLGIYLIKNLMDDVSYIRENDTNILSIAKTI